MAINDYISKAADPLFYKKVGFIALKVANNVSNEAASTPDHDIRLAYANSIFRGEENLQLLAMHMISQNGSLQNTINDGGEPTDGDLEFVFGEIWTARAKAFA